MRRQTVLTLVAGGVLASRAGAFAQDLPVVRIATNTVDSLAEPYYGSERGIFRDNGLNAQVSTLANGSTNVQAVVAGDLDVGLANITQVAAGVIRNVGIVMIAPAALYSAKHSYSAMCVAKGSPIASAKDLIDKTIGVSTLNDFNQLGVAAWLEKNNVSASKVKFVEIHFPEMGAALQRGTIAAATISEPSLSGALTAGQVRVFANVYSAIAPEFSNIVWFASTKWLQANADAAKRLVKAIFATAQYANTHQAETAEILVRVAKLDPAIVPNMTRAFFATSNDPKYVQAPLDFSYKYGLISRPLSFAEIMGVSRNTSG